MSHELQDRYARLNWNFTALDVVLSGIYRTDVPRRQPEARERKLALATMGELGVALLAPRRFLELSRGEQRRVLIARGVAFEPSVLLLDEPASGLDRAARIELELCSSGCRSRSRSSARPMSKPTCPRAIDRILRLERGRIVASATRSTPTGGGHERHAARGASAAHSGRAGGYRPRRAERARAPDRRPADRERPLPLVEIENASIWLGSRRVLRDFDGGSTRGSNGS